jgi:mannose-6-phosphate isomerase-like protein (cupin superfamily)
MRHTITAFVVAGIVASGFLARSVRLQANHPAADHGSVIEHDGDVARREPGTHNGGGETTGYSFFATTKDPAVVFRKRALHAGSAIGLHTQKVDEVYYILSGTGELTLDGEKHQVAAGTAILTRPGSSHALKQTGTDDLVMIIAYPPETQK